MARFLRRTLRNGSVSMLLGVWFALMVVVSAILLSKHLIALPRPANDDAALASAMNALRDPSDTRQVTAIHVLYAECACSLRIAEHLVTSERPAGVDEHVILVGTNAALEQKLVAHRFDVVHVSAEELATLFHVQAVPLLVVLGPDHRVRYSGGYTTRKQGPVLRDLDLIARAKSESAIEALPVFGCAVSQKLRERLDPSGVL